MTRTGILLALALLCGCASTQTMDERRLDALTELRDTRIQFTKICSHMPGAKHQQACDNQNRKTFAAFGFHVGAAPDRASLEGVISVIDRCTDRESHQIDEGGPLVARSFLASINGCVNATLAAR